MGDVVDFKRAVHLGNGAREAIRDALTAVKYHPHAELEFYDALLAHLWAQGFKIVPIEERSPGHTAGD